MNRFATIIADMLNLKVENVAGALSLLDLGATIPFISRYRKERTGGLNEVEIAAISNMNERLKEIERRKRAVLKTIGEQNKLTPALERRINDCWNSTELEDIYIPFRPKRRTRAQTARQQGLEPLSDVLMRQSEPHPEYIAKTFLSDAVTTVEAALRGAKDIIAEQVSEDEHARQTVRGFFRRQAVIKSKVVKDKRDSDEAQKFSDYFDWSEPLKRCSSHRLLAMRRGESEGVLRVSITIDDEECIGRLCRLFQKGFGPCTTLVGEAVDDSFRRLLKPGIETEFAALSKERADDEAIAVFATNLRQLLLAPPLGQKRVIAIDPGFRTGCKVVCLDAQGQLLHHDVIYLNYRMQASVAIERMVGDYSAEAIAIGNGTAGRETRELVDGLNLGIPLFVVSEDGASVYSASKTAREEFPDQDVTVRGAVSIGRRLMDPLAELVKIDPKSIGVGQYQHDVDQGKLKQQLHQTVELCVNTVGVNLNTASVHLLQYVSGLGPSLAAGIIARRNERGPFTSREELKKVPRLGPATFQQCAGFLRIPGGKNPLDNTAVHPESYSIVEQMADDRQCTVTDLIRSADLRETIDLKRYAGSDVGMPTLIDIMKELEKPGRDPREQIEQFAFDSRVKNIGDLESGMILPGIVTNITKFGAFVDIGVHHDGLVHISQIANRYVRDPNKVVKLHQHVKVKVLEIDLRRNRISLTMRI